MKIGSSVPDSITPVELSKPDKWQNWQGFASHCLAWQLQWRAVCTCCVFRSVTKRMVRRDPGLCMLLGSCPCASSVLWERGEWPLAGSSTAGGTKLLWREGLGEPSSLPGGGWAGRRRASLPQAADALADELCLCLLVFLRRGPGKACVGFVLPGCPLSCRTAKQGWRKGVACGVAACSIPQDL